MVVMRWYGPMMAFFTLHSPYCLLWIFATTFDVAEKKYCAARREGHFSIHTIVWIPLCSGTTDMPRCAYRESRNNNVKLFRFIGDRISFHNVRAVIDDANVYGTVPFSTLHVFDCERPEKKLSTFHAWLQWTLCWVRAMCKRLLFILDASPPSSIFFVVRFSLGVVLL